MCADFGDCVLCVVDVRAARRRSSYFAAYFYYIIYYIELILYYSGSHTLLHKLHVTPHTFRHTKTHTLLYILQHVCKKGDKVNGAAAKNKVN